MVRSHFGLVNRELKKNAVRIAARTTAEIGGGMGVTLSKFDKTILWHCLLAEGQFHLRLIGILISATPANVVLTAEKPRVKPKYRRPGPLWALVAAQRGPGRRVHDYQTRQTAPRQPKYRKSAQTGPLAESTGIQNERGDCPPSAIASDWPRVKKITILSTRLPVDAGRKMGHSYQNMASMADSRFRRIYS
jgi:hypothetical protein